VVPLTPNDFLDSYIEIKQTTDECHEAEISSVHDVYTIGVDSDCDSPNSKDDEHQESPMRITKAPSQNNEADLQHKQDDEERSQCPRKRSGARPKTTSWRILSLGIGISVLL